MHIKSSDLGILKLGIGNYTCNWGSHICGLYEKEEERDEIIFGYLNQGMKDADFALYIHSEQSEENFTNNFIHHCPECEAHINNPESLEIKKAKDLYYPSGTFDPWIMDTAVNGYFEYTQRNGPRNFRAIAEMAWAHEAIPGVEHLFAYESRLNYFVQNRTVISICLYNITKMTGGMIMNVLRTHPFAINGGVITQNPYFVHPDIWLAENAPQFLNR